MKTDQLSITLVPWLEAGRARSERLVKWNKVIFLQIFLL